MRYLSKKDLKERLTDLIGQPQALTGKGHGAVGKALEDLLGTDGSNIDLPDAGLYEIKTSYSSSTPTTLFHKDPKAEGFKTQAAAVKRLVEEFGWPSDYKGESVKSFRATIWKSWTSRYDRTLEISADQQKIQVMEDGKEWAFWKTEELVGIAASKLRNVLFVEAERKGGSVIFRNATFYEQFRLFNFIKLIDQGKIAIDFDARTKPDSQSIRNHGVKFRIKEVDKLDLYTIAEKI